MKKLNLILVMVLASAMAFMTSCKTDEQDLAAPTIKFDQESWSMNVSVLTVTGTVTAPGGIQEISYFLNGTTLTDDDLSGHKEFKKGDTEFKFSITLKEPQNGKFQIVVLDKQDPAKKGDETTTIGSGSVTNVEIVESKEDIKLHTALGGYSAKYPHYASLTDFSTYTFDDAVKTADKVDVGFYVGNYTKSMAAHLFSPDNFPTKYTIENGKTISNANSTMFHVLTAEEIAGFGTATDIAAYFNELTIDQKNVEVANGSVVAFKLADGKKGAITVTGLTATDASDSDNISFSVKVQKEAPAAK